MNRECVSSSTVVSVGYDASIETLEVEFKTGVYQYLNVPSSIFEEFLAADSKGKFLNVYVKNSYACSKL